MRNVLLDSVCKSDTCDSTPPYFYCEFGWHHSFIFATSVCECLVQRCERTPLLVISNMLCSVYITITIHDFNANWRRKCKLWGMIY